jgi:hypothetical protein
MIFNKLFQVIFIILVIFSCKSSTKKRDVITVDSPNTLKFWSQNDISASSEGFLLKNQGSALASKFKVRNFEFTVKLKTTVRAEGIIVFSNPDGVSDKGYTVKINNSDYRDGDPQKTGSLSKIRNNFIRTTADEQWLNLALSVKGDHIKVVVDNKTIIDYVEPSMAVRSAGLTDKMLTKGFLMVKKTSTGGQILIGEMTYLPLEEVLRAENITAAEPDSLMKVIDMLN